MPILRDVLTSILDYRTSSPELDLWTIIAPELPPYEQTPVEAAAGLVPVNFMFPAGHLFRWLTDAERADFIAGAMTLTLNTATQNWATTCPGADGILPAGNAKVTSSINVPAGTCIRGEGSFSRITGWACNAFEVDGDFVTLENMALFNVSAIGAADPRTNDGIKTTGVSGTPRNFLTVRDIYVQGFANCLNLEYAVLSDIDNISTINCTRGVRIFGLSVNLTITNSRITANGGGDASIRTLINGGDRPEGLMVSNCLLSSGDYGVKSDGCVAMSVVGCIVDLIQLKAFELSGVTALLIDCPWLYAAGSCIDLLDQGSPSEIGAVISVASAQTTGTGGHCIRIGNNNNGVTIRGGKIILSNAASANYPIAMTADGGIVEGVRVINATAQKGILVSAADVRIGNLTGDISVNRTAQLQYTASLTGCTTVPTGTIVYTIDGETVTLQVPSITGTSNTTAATLTGMPSSIWPITAQEVTGRTQDNGVTNFATLIVGTAGTITLCSNVTSATFTNVGTKGVGTRTVTYKRT